MALKTLPPTLEVPVSEVSSASNSCTAILPLPATAKESQRKNVKTGPMAIAQVKRFHQSS